MLSAKIKEIYSTNLYIYIYKIACAFPVQTNWTSQRHIARSSAPGTQRGRPPLAGPSFHGAARVPHGGLEGLERLVGGAGVGGVGWVGGVVLGRRGSVG